MYYKHKSVISQEGDSTEDTKKHDPTYATTIQTNVTDTNTAYGTTTAIKMNTNPAYATTNQLVNIYCVFIQFVLLVYIACMCIASSSFYIHSQY